jgi:hypothetical protein
MKHTIPVKEDKYFETMLHVLSGMVKMTDFEIEILVNMFSNEIKVLDSDTRTKIRIDLDKSEFNFNNYIRKMKGKNILVSTKDGLIINPSIVAAIEDKTITIKIDVDQNSN